MLIWLIERVFYGWMKFNREKISSLLYFTFLFLYFVLYTCKQLLHHKVKNMEIVEQHSFPRVNLCQDDKIKILTFAWCFIASTLLTQFRKLHHSVLLSFILIPSQSSTLCHTTFTTLSWKKHVPYFPQNKTIKHKISH